MLSLSTRRLLAISAMMTVAAIAQDQPAEMKDLQSVYVRDSGVASEKLALAERMERLREWDKSANVYQEIIEKYADRVIPTRSDSTGQVTQYTSVALVVQERLAKWQDEGLAVYKSRYEDAAREMLDKAQGDRDQLQRVMSQYFPTESAKTAGMRLLALSLERGEFSSAAWVGRRLLSYHPSLLIERPRVLFLTAIAEHLAGNKTGAAQRLDELKQKFPDAVAVVRGEEQNLVAVLEKELASQPSLVKTFRSDSWPVPFGNPEASAVPAQASYGGARMFSVEIPKARLSRNANLRQYEAQIEQQRKLGGLTGIMPVVDDGELFFQDNARVYAINLISGLPLPGWLQSHPGNKRGAYTIDAIASPRGKPLGLCVTDRSVVAVLGQSDNWASNVMAMSSTPSQLVCLDRANGRPAWSTTMQKLRLPEELANLREGQFSGMPLVIDDNVFVVVRANRGAQFEEVHLVSLAMRDGAFQWSSYVASTASSNGMMDFDGDFSSSTANAMLSYSDGRVYVQTNLGAIACMDATDGKTLWLNIYPRTSDGRRNRLNRPFIGQQNQVSKPFAQNPPMIVDGRLFTAPPDSSFILVYDAASGEEIKRINRALERPKHEPVDMLLAVVGDEMILGSRLAVFSIPWQAWDPAKSIMANRGKYKVFDYTDAVGGAKQEEAIRGRPFVSETDLFIPLASGLNRFSIKEWRTANVYPQKGEWDLDEEAPGNVLATPDHLVIAASNRVTVYADLTVATRKLDEQLAADPTAVEPHLRYAELLLAGGRARDAVDWLDKSVDRLGDRANLPHGPMRDRLFEIVSGFASKLQRTDAATPEVIRQLFERARLAADTPQQQVRYRMAHAAFLRKTGEASEEVAIYQQILAEPAWRSQSVAGRAGTSTAAAEAEAAIAELIAKEPSLYAPYEAEAKEKLDAIEKQADANAAMYIAIADRWPLSDSTVPALRKAAELYEQEKHYRESNQTLRKLLKRSKDNSLKVQTLEALARSYSLLPNQADLAVVRLDQAAKLNPQRVLARPIPLENGEKIENLTLQDAVGVLKGYRAIVTSRSLPTLGLPSGDVQPLPAAFKPAESLDGVSAIVKQQDNASRPDRVVAFRTDSSVVQLDAGSIAPMHDPVKIDDAPIGCAYFGDTLIVITQQGAVAIADDKAIWRVSLGGLPGAEVATAEGVAEVREDDDDEGEAFIDGRAMPGDIRRLRLANGRIRALNGMLRQPMDDEFNEGGPERISHFRVLSDRVVVGTTGGRVVSFDLNNGAANWQARPSDLPLRHFAAIDDFVVVASTDQTSATDMTVLDSITGQITSRTTFENRQPLVNMALSRDGVLVVMLMNELSAYDLYETTLATTTWKRGVGNRGNGEVPFLMSGQQDQLVITDGRVLAVGVTNERTQSVRAFDLRTGEPKRSKDARQGRVRDVDTTFPSGAVAGPNQEPPAIYIRPVGPIFYIVGPKSLKAFHLDQGWTWGPDPKGMADRGVVRDFLVAQDMCVLLTQTVAVNANAPKISSIQFMAHSRQVMDNGVESGLLEHRPILRDPAGILPTQWQIANGSFYYVSADQKLKMLKANR